MVGLLAAITMASAISPFRQSARWIWDGELDRPVDTYRLFRKTFELKSRPSSAPIHITADAEYRLYVNGKYVGRGPAPNPPSHISVDKLDVASYLKSGKNAVGVIVYHLGVQSFPRVLGRAGLFAQIDLPGQAVSTDATWKWHDAWWEPTGERFSGFREFTEHLDGRKEQAGWAEPRFDDSAWRAAAEIGPAGTAPWTAMEERDIPMPDHRPTYAASVVFTSICSPTPPAKKEAAAELAKVPWKPDTSTAAPFERLAGNRPSSVTVDTATAGRIIGIDFGREVSGYPELTVENDRDGAVIDAGYGEGIEADGHVSVRRQGNPDCDRFTLRKGSQTLRIFHHRAFRYMLLAVRGGKETIHPPQVIESGYPVQMKGSFASSDPRLDKIWQVGRRTMQICMDQGFMDCPWRERGQYIGDGLAELPAALYAFGDTTLMRRFLRQAQFCQPADGMLEPAYPNDWTLWHGQRGPNRIPGYGALWVVMLDQYYHATGDKALVSELLPTMKRLMAWFEPHVGSDGLLAEIPEWNFIDWAKMDPKSQMACLNLQYLWALRSAASLCAAAGEKSAYDEQAAKLAKRFDEVFWSEPDGLYRDAANVLTEHTNALALLILVEDPARASRIIAKLDDPLILKPESPYFEGFVLRALCKHGRHDLALKTIREKWGNMIDHGATTFWESYGAQWSLCHAWSCTPTALLSEEVLGVRYDAAAKRIYISPHTLGLASAKGVAPLSCGNVAVQWENPDGDFRLKFAAPPGTTVQLEVPASDHSRIFVNGQEDKLSKRLNGRTDMLLGGGDGKWDIVVKP